MRNSLFMLVGLMIGVGAACFRLPDSNVLFACDPVMDPACPDGYTCEADGCCHKDGSDVQAEFGACRISLEGGSETGSDESASTDDSGSDESSDSDSSESGTDTESDSSESDGSDSEGSDSGSESDGSDSDSSDSTG